MSRARAFTLVEVILASALAFVLLSLCVAVLVPLARATARSADQVDLRQMAYVSLDRLSADLGRSAPEGITVGADVIAIQPLVDLSADGLQVWDSQLIVWFWNHGQLRRRLWPPAPPDLGWAPSPSRPRHPSPAELGRLAVSSDSQVLAGFVESFEVSGGRAPLFVQPISLSLRLKREKESYSLSTTVFLRNSAKKN